MNSVVYCEYKPAVTEGLTWNVSTWVTVTHYLFVLPFSFFAQVTRFLDVNSFSLWFLNSPANINPRSAQWDRSPLLKKSILRAALLLSFFFFFEGSPFYFLSFCRFSALTFSKSSSLNLQFNCLVVPHFSSLPHFSPLFFFTACYHLVIVTFHSFSSLRVWG